MSSLSMLSQVSTANSTTTQRSKQADLNSDSSVQCPITLDVMQDPVTAADGRNYERAAIEGHFATGRHTSPRTGAALASLELGPNRQLQRRCQEFSRKQEARRAGRAQREAEEAAKRTKSEKERERKRDQSRRKRAQKKKKAADS